MRCGRDDRTVHLNKLCKTSQLPIYISVRPPRTQIALILFRSGISEARDFLRNDSLFFIFKCVIISFEYTRMTVFNRNSGTRRPPPVSALHLQWAEFLW